MTTDAAQKSPLQARARGRAAAWLLLSAMAAVMAGAWISTAVAASGEPSPPATPAATPEADPSQRCAVPAQIGQIDDPLAGFALALKRHAEAGTPLTIVVLGSLSTVAKGERVPDFPDRLQASLGSRLAARGISVPLRVEMVGRTRALTGELTGLVTRQVLPRQPALVIWQAGRADARRGNPPYRFGKSLAEGLDVLRRHGIDTIVADIRYHPQFEALFRTDDYRNYVRWVAGERDLPLLRRYEMIEYWAMAGLIDLDSANDAMQKTAYAFIQECLAFQAARMIMEGAGLAP